MTSQFYDPDEFEINIDEEEGPTAGDIEDDRVMGEEEYKDRVTRGGRR